MPQSYKQKYSIAEFDPYCLIVTNLPLNCTAEELHIYLDTLVYTVKPEYGKTPPIKNVDMSHNNNFCITTCANKEIKSFFKINNDLKYKESSLKVNALFS